MAQNYPSPFNPSRTIGFVVPISGHTTLKMYNVLRQDLFIPATASYSHGKR
jgi:hypothetical protein